MVDTRTEHFQRLLFYVLVLLAGYLTYLVLSPFLASLAWAAVFATMLYDTHLKLASRIGANRSALVMTLLAGALVVTPAVMLVSAVAHEAPQVIERLQQVSVAMPYQAERVWAEVVARSPVALPPDPGVLLSEGFKRLLTFLAPRAGAVVADVFATIGSLIVMLFALFFMLRDGDLLARQLRQMLPLPLEECDRLIKQTQDLVIASVGAGLLVAVVQGTIGGIAYWLLGLSAPALWGVVTGICSLIPVVGATLVWVPATIALFISGEISRGIILLVVGVLGISMADNILRPLFLSGRTSVSGLVIFLGLLGGVSALGFIGLVLGPIILVTTGRLLVMFTRSGLIDPASAPGLDASIGPSSLKQPFDR